MSFQDAIKICFQKYADFSGRAKRPEHWWFVLFYMLGSLGLRLIEGALGIGGIVSALFALGMLLPLLAVLVRRLRDTDRSGWWALIGLVPVVGPLVLIYFAAQPSA